MIWRQTFPANILWVVPSFYHHFIIINLAVILKAFLIAQNHIDYSKTWISTIKQVMRRIRIIICIWGLVCYRSNTVYDSGYLTCSKKLTGSQLSLMTKYHAHSEFEAICMQANCIKQTRDVICWFCTKIN